MRRREFITLIGSAVTWPLAAKAQSRDRLRRVALLMGFPEGDAEGQACASAFPDGRLALAVFRTPQENKWATAALSAVRHMLPPITPPGPEEPGEFSWAYPGRVHRILEGAGFKKVSLTPHEPAMPLAGPGGAAEGGELCVSCRTSSASH